MLLAYCCHFVLSLSCCVVIANAGTTALQQTASWLWTEYRIPSCWYSLMPPACLPNGTQCPCCTDKFFLLPRTDSTAIYTLHVAQCSHCNSWHQNFLAWHHCRLRQWLMQHNLWQFNASHGIHCTSLGDWKADAGCCTSCSGKWPCPCQCCTCELFNFNFSPNSAAAWPHTNAWCNATATIFACLLANQWGTTTLFVAKEINATAVK